MWLKRACCWTLLASLTPLALADEDYLPSAPLGEAGLMKSWQLHLRLDPDQQLTGLFLVDDQLYAATNDGYVFAVHAETGANRWLRRVTSEGYRLRQPCHAGDRTVFATPTTVLELDRLTGDGEAKHRLTFPCGTAPVSDGEHLFIGGLEQRVYAFDVLNFVYGWKAITNGPITSTPVLYENNLFVASSDGTVYSCVADNKGFRWQMTIGGSITADLAVNERGLYVPNGDQSLYLLDLQFGQVAWRARFSGPLYEAPVVTADTAYQYCPDDGLVAVNTVVVGVADRLRWKLPRGRTFLTLDGRMVSVLAMDETVLVVNNEDGRVVYTLPAAGMTLAAPSPNRTAIYVASADGRLFCARPRGTPVVSQNEVRQALSPPETQPAEAGEVGTTTKPAEKEEPDRLTTGRKGLPLGGKSKVSKGFGKGGEPAGGTKP